MKKIKVTRYKITCKDKGVKPFFHGSLLYGDHTIDGCFSNSFNGKSKAQVIKKCKRALKKLVDSFYIEVEEFYE